MNTTVIKQNESSNFSTTVFGDTRSDDLMREENLVRKALIIASGQVLTEVLPADFMERGKAEMDRFVEDHVHSLFEDWTVGMLWEHMGGVAKAMLQFNPNKIPGVNSSKRGGNNDN